LPVEVTAFGHGTTARRLGNATASLGYRDTAIRQRQGFITDSGNVIYDCGFGAIRDPRLLAMALAVIPGVVDHGLFLNLASTLVIAGSSGVEIIEKK
jgi:ribose 5-phosphate isomerase A